MFETNETLKFNKKKALVLNQNFKRKYEKQTLYLL